MGTKVTIITMTLCWMVRKAVELTWTTDVLSAGCYKGCNSILVWNYSTEENDRIRQLQWYYNKTTLICYNSESYGFHVAPLYEGRVEQHGTSGILLKNVSSNDTGEYTLYPKLSGEKFRNVQSILLTVSEPPVHKCKPAIRHSRNFISCSASLCGAPHFSQEWRLEGMHDPVSRESRLELNSSWTGKLVFCCPYDPRMECRNVNKLESCTPYLISSTPDATTIKEYIHKEDLIQMHTEKAPNERDAAHVGPLYLPWLIGLVLLLVTTMIIVALLLVWYSRTRQSSVKTKPKPAKVAKECRVERAPLQTVLAPTDGRSPGSGQNQNIQIVNNINMDSDILSRIINSALNTELLALKEENRKSQYPPYRQKCWIELNERMEVYDESSDLTRVDVFGSRDSDTEISAPSDYEDAITDII